MKRVIQYAFVRPLLFASLTVVGCDGANDATLPAGASPRSGATIQGTVNPSAGAVAQELAASSASGAGLRVTVSGTSLSTTTDSSGRFTLTGVPAGNVELRFQGSGVDATVRVEGLVEGQVLTISVQVSGSNASVISGPNGRQEAQLEGMVESIASPRLRVSSRNVMTDSATRFKRVQSLGGLRVGDRVHVKGTLQSDGSILASEIERQGPKDDDDEDDAELEGRIDSITPPTLQVAGRTVRTDSATRIERGKKKVLLGELRVGERVDVEGTRQPDGSILARTIEVD